MAYFGGETKRVKKIDAPLLVVGLGGTGADGLRRIKNEFGQRLEQDRLGTRELDRPPRTAYLLLDTDPGELTKRYHGTVIDKDNEWLDLSWDIEYALDREGANLSPSIKSWLDSKFYTDASLRQDAAYNGAGTYRQLSRMMMFRKAQDVVTKLEALLTRLATVPAGAPAGARKINVVVISGLSGGTGSGSFLDFAYLVRHAANQVHMPIRMDLYVVGPDVTINRQAITDQAKQKIYKTNSFAALKELDYWMSIDTRVKAHTKEENVTVDYGGGLIIPWDQRPYDDVTLLCATNAKGVLLENAYDVVLSSVTEMLLFMMAEESTSIDVISQYANAAQDEDSYSFQSQRSNENAYRRRIQKPYPQSYCYRAIGAYSNLGEQRNKVSLEAQLLFKDIEDFQNDPVHIPVMKGTAPEEFQQPMHEKLQLLIDDFCNATLIDEQMFNGVSPYSRQEIADGDASLAPHGNIHEDWIRRAEAQTAILQNEFTKALREQFVQMARDYIRKHGPEALRTMLSAPDTGFIVWMRDKRSSCETQENQNRSTYNNFFASINSKFVELVDVCGRLSGLPYRQKVFEQYLSALRAIYTAKQNELAMKVVGGAIETVTGEIQTQILDRNLKFSIDALKQIKEDLDDDVRNIPTASDPAHVLNMQVLRNQIVAAYRAEDNQKKLMNTLLEATAEAAINFDDAGTSVETASSTLIGRLDSMIDTVFKTVNDSSLQRQLVNFNNDVNADGVDGYVKDVIAPQLWRGAQVHFNVASNYGGLNSNNAVISSYISVPAGADKVRSGIKQFIESGEYSGAVIKNSAIDDRIFWMNIVSGLPLCAVGYLAQYEVTYEDERKRHPGIHLITMNDDDLQKLNKKRSVLDDWNMLPSPVPFMLLGAKPAPESLVTDQREKRTLAEAAEKAQVLNLTMQGADPVQYRAELAFFGESINPMTAEALTEKIQLAKSSSASADDVEAALQALLSQRTKYDLIDDERQDQQTESFSKAESINLSGIYRQSEDAKRTCFRELAYYRLSQRPALMIELKKQMGMTAQVQKAIDEVRKGSDELRSLKDAAVVVARLTLYECIRLRLMKVLHINALEQFDTNGTENVLFGQNDVLQKEPWVNFLPIQVKLTEWYAAQNREDQPFATIEEIMQDRYSKSLDPDDTPEDIAMCKGYQNKAETLVKDLEIKSATVKQNQKQLPREEYNKALMIIETMITELKGLALTWSNI